MLRLAAVGPRSALRLPRALPSVSFSSYTPEDDITAHLRTYNRYMDRLDALGTPQQRDSVLRAILTFSTADVQVDSPLKRYGQRALGRGASGCVSFSSAWSVCGGMQEAGPGTAASAHEAPFTSV